MEVLHYTLILANRARSSIGQRARVNLSIGFNEEVNTMLYVLHIISYEYSDGVAL